MATLEELTTPLSRADVEASIYAAIEARGVNTTSWKPGAIARAIITATAIVLSAFSSLSAQIARSGFLNLAEGDWLELVARHVFGVEKITGTFARGSVTLTNTAGGVFNVSAGDLILRNASTGRTYRNVAAFTLGALGSVTITVEAIELGSASSAIPDAITEFETPLNGVTATNPAALVGLDQESDVQLRTRCLAKLGSLSPNGPRDAYVFAALSAVTSNGQPAGVTRVTTVADGIGGVTVYVANAAGPLTGTLGDDSTPLGAVNKAIQENVVPEGITATVVNATSLSVAPTYEIWVRSSIGLTASELQTEIAARLLSFFATQPIGGSRKVAGGGFVFLDAISAAISGAVSTGDFVDLDLTVPAADVAVGATEAPVLGAVTATINLVAI